MPALEHEPLLIYYFHLVTVLVWLFVLGADVYRYIIQVILIAPGHVLGSGRHWLVLPGGLHLS